MIRHFSKHKFKNALPGQRLVQPRNSVWKLPPYEIAFFSGQLMQVMMKAAQDYIAKRSLQELQQEFAQTAFHHQDQDQQFFSATSKKNAT